MFSGPEFSIVLPVRNGGEYVKQCVASVLAQTWADRFELLVLDNASTDGTAEWLAGLQDPRLRVYPSERSLTIEENWARIKDLPKREFLTTIGHDDLLDPNFLEVISRLIREHPDAGLYCTHFRLIDAEGAFLRHCRFIPARENAAEFVAARLCDLRDSYGTGHVFRSAAYDAIGGIPPYPKLLYADDALFLQAIGASYRATALDEAFSYRWHIASASTGCAMADLFAGFEQYGRLLAEYSGRDEELAEVLRRYFPAHAARVGGVWRQEVHYAAYRTRTAVDPGMEERIARLVSLGGGRAPAPMIRPLGERLLERAFRSSADRAWYGAWLAQQRCRERFGPWLSRKLGRGATRKP